MNVLQWMKRGLVISSALLSIGLCVPTDFVRDVHAEQPDKTQDEKTENPLIYKVNQESYELFHEVLPSKTDDYIHRNASSADLINHFIVKQAHEQSMRKFGDTISGKISNPFEESILPLLQTVIRETTKTLPEEEWAHLKVSTNPAGGLGEKILHLYNEENGKDIFRFHVRRDQPPKQGYYFNFHYHTYLDHYENHHNLGTIYWGKDMPPRWNGEDRV
ncbi:YpjP family protein [Halalkalibacter nanhaiisediminis]|uniref:YpjP family protein n=1 Tax=Halalkalibacter nanhaiisediminis TaxID=688079 RepID=UPI001F55504A|nr:YpjP family protein [Halalkalibacter nanhaiisediminis]